MPLGITVTLLVLGVTVLTAVAAYLIDKDEEREERKQFTQYRGGERQ
jgi:hypothetical protein